MKGTKWIDKSDGKEYTYESQGRYMGWDKVKSEIEYVGVVVLSTVIAEGMSIVIPTIMFLKNFVPKESFVPKKGKPTSH
jgi:hypothetical protein